MTKGKITETMSIGKEKKKAAYIQGTFLKDGVKKRWQNDYFCLMLQYINPVNVSQLQDRTTAALFFISQ